MNYETIQHELQKILDVYVQARTKESFAGHSLRTDFESVKVKLAELPAISNSSTLKVKWSMGQGNWAKVPWIALLDERETATTQRGVYCVYLFRQDMSGVYLTFNQGVTHLIEDKGKPGAYAVLRARAQELRPLCAQLVNSGFRLDEAIDLKAEPGLGADYEPSTIAHKFYEAGKIPDDKILLSDFAALVSVYEKYLQRSTRERPREPEVTYGLDSLADSFINLATNAEVALRLSSSLAFRFIAATLSKRFLILTGLAGSGKTKLAQALARWITPKQGGTGEGLRHFVMVPIGADWTGNENVLGYPNGLDKDSYVTKPALELILQATNHPDLPYFLILDEMNLSHVERYFADILSAIESEEGLELYPGGMDSPATWRKAASTTLVPPKLERLPENLFIIGTVNVDETTYMFSPKVLDRANVIEFRMDAGELEGFLHNSAKPDLSKLDGRGVAFGRAFVEATKSPVYVPDSVKAIYKGEMLLFFRILQEHDAEFGYRVAHEAARFIHFYHLLGKYSDGDTSWFAGAFDCVVVQKFLPKLHGSRAKLGPLLKKLWFLCVFNEAGRGAEPFRAAGEAVRSTDKQVEPSTDIPIGAPYPLSAEKIGRMWRLLNENGFTSFAEA